MKFIKEYEKTNEWLTIESWQDSAEEGSDEYLETFEYFYDTYINGQFGQLRKMLDSIKDDGSMENLLVYLEENAGENLEEIKSWIIKTM